jgi:hypothetical protein
VLNAGFRLDALRHILEHENRAIADSLVADTFYIALTGKLENVTRLASGDKVGHAGAYIRHIIMRKQTFPRAIAQQHFQPAPVQLGVLGDPQHRLGLVVDHRNALLAVEHEQALRHIVERGIETPRHN